SDIIHQSVMELIHSEDREEFKRQLTWNSMLPSDKSALTLHETMLPENMNHLHRSFTVRFRCLLDNTSGFITSIVTSTKKYTNYMKTSIVTSTKKYTNYMKTSSIVTSTKKYTNYMKTSIVTSTKKYTNYMKTSSIVTSTKKYTNSMKTSSIVTSTKKYTNSMKTSIVTPTKKYTNSIGKAMFAYTDQELATKSGYDLIHPDDLNYFSSAHNELIKTGSSGLISYRWQTKHQHWVWLQSSCKVIYKNSKPDFIICTHRQLTEDEGHDLFGKRGNEFKLPYPLLDIDMCSGFGFGDDDLVTKSKSSKSKKKSNSASPGANAGTANGAQSNGAPANYASAGGGGGKDYQGGKRRKSAACLIGGDTSLLLVPHGFTAYDGGGGGEMKPPEAVYPYAANNFGFEADLYRPQGYGSLTPYPTADPYKLDMDKHGYFLDHRQYQHSSFPYPNNGYSEFVPSTKYGYDVPKYGFDSYSLDLSKRVDCGDISQFHPRYPFDYHHHSYHPLDHPPLHTTEFTAPRLSSLDAVDLRNSAALFGSNSFMNTVETPCASSSPCSAASVFKAVPSSNHMIVKDQSLSKLHKLGNGMGMMDASPNPMPYDMPSALPHNTVIKSTRHQDSGLLPSNHLQGQQDADSVIPHQQDDRMLWNSCSKNAGNEAMVMSSVETNQQQSGDMVVTPKCRSNVDQGAEVESRIDCGEDIMKNNENQLRMTNKESAITGIPVSVVKQSPWLHTNVNNNHNILNNNNASVNNGGHLANMNGNSGLNNANNLLMSEREWGTNNDYYSKTPRVLFPDPCHSVKHLGLKVYERGDNPLLSFSEMTHTLMSSTH
uniref:PAS domain-containing protein n=1 Tax=Biomphalaria glabrata TaxID=6526 RepID=A0A2C9M9I8_BIOGL